MQQRSDVDDMDLSISSQELSEQGINKNDTQNN